MSFLKATAVGNIGSMQDIKYLDNGMAILKFSIATNDKVKDKSGSWNDVTTWVSCTIWGKQAENCVKYLSIGKQVYVEGKLKLNEYENKDGINKVTLELNVNDVQFLSFDKNDNEDIQEPVKQKSTKVSVSVDSEIPF